MYKARVELEMSIDVPKGIVPVIVVQVCIASEHLFYDALNIVVEIGIEAGRSADPVVLHARKLRERVVQICRRGGDRRG